MVKYVLGFDIGGTKSGVILGDVEGNILGKISAETEISAGPYVTIDRLIRHAKALVSDKNLLMDEIAGVGVACGGPLDAANGLILSPPNLPSWDRVPITKIIEEELKISAVLENDADCCALAEFFFGAGKNKKNVLSFTWGTGIGAGLVLNGRLYSGTKGGAGEIGHITYKDDGRACACGKRGCVEAYGSGASMARIANEKISEGRKSMLSLNNRVDAKSICECARAGDVLSIEVLTEAAKAMGRAVAVAAQLLNPEIITLGTMAIKAHDLLMPIILEVIEQEVWQNIRADLRVLPSPLGDKIQDLSALAAFLGRGC